MGNAYIGVDLGGTKLSAAVWRGGRLSGPTVVPTGHDDSERLIGEIADAIRDVRSSDCAAVGVGTPSQVDFEAGRIRATVNLPLTDVPLKKELEARVDMPVFIDNDANVAAIGEAHDGISICVRDLVMITLGTGVGGGLVLNGRVFRGATGAAAELGHCFISADVAKGAPKSQGFPQPGSFERNASGRALDELARNAAEAHPESALGRLARKGEVSGVEAVSLALEGDKLAVDLVRILGERLGVGISNVLHTFDPDVVAVGGGVCRAGELLLEPARRVARELTVPGVGTKTEIRISLHGTEAGVRGAALLAKVEHEERSGL